MAEELRKEDEESIVDYTDTDVKTFDKPVVKEYEKLLFQDESRLKGVKALKLVKLGQFYQYKKETNEIDFNDLKKLDGAKMVSNHQLYERISDGTFFYILAESEETTEGVKKVYRYDVIELDNVDDETYKKLISAHSHEGGLLNNIFICASIIVLLISILGTIIQFVYLVVDAKSTLPQALASGVVTNLLLIACASALCAIAIISKKNHEEK